MAKNEVTTNEILDFLKENMVVKEEFEERMTGVEGRISGVENRLTGVENRLDSLEQSFARFEVELKDVKEALRRLEKMVKEDTDALAGEVDNLRARVAVLEKKFNQLQSSAI